MQESNFRAIRDPRGLSAPKLTREGGERFGDGWISSEAKQTFQKGITRDEIVWLLGAVGINLSECALKLDSGAGAGTQAWERSSELTGAYRVPMSSCPGFAPG
jgi:hypothetical protein